MKALIFVRHGFNGEKINYMLKSNKKKIITFIYSKKTNELVR